jgi:hypothetical protein
VSRKKAEEERKEKELQEKLELQREQIENQLGIAIGTPKTIQTAQGGQKQDNRSTRRTEKPLGRPPTRPPTSRPVLRKRKLFTTSQPPMHNNLEDTNGLSEPGNEVNQVPIEGADEQSNGDTEMVDEEMHIESEFNAAFAELNDEFFDETLEELFNDTPVED